MPPATRSIIAGGRDKRMSVDKYPVLPKLADDVIDLAFEAFRPRLSTPVQFRRVEIAADREEEILTGVGANCLAGLLHDPAWSCNIGVLLQGDFVYTLIEAMLGADGGDAPYAEKRALTTIERSLSRCFVEALAAGLNQAITPMEPLDLAFEKFDTRLEFVTLGGRGEDAVAIRYRMEALKRSGDVILVLPQRAIARIAAPLSEPPTSAPRRVDPQWTRDFEHRVTGAEIALQAFTEIADLRLADVAAFRQGQVLTLPPEALQDVTLTAEGRRLFTCELGQSEGRYSLRVAAEYDPEAASRKKVHALGY